MITTTQLKNGIDMIGTDCLDIICSYVPTEKQRELWEIEKLDLKKMLSSLRPYDWYLDIKIKYLKQPINIMISTRGNYVKVQWHRRYLLIKDEQEIYEAIWRVIKSQPRQKAYRWKLKHKRTTLFTVSRNEHFII